MTNDTANPKVSGFPLATPCFKVLYKDPINGSLWSSGKHPEKYGGSHHYRLGLNMASSPLLTQGYGLLAFIEYGAAKRFTKGCSDFVIYRAVGIRRMPLAMAYTWYKRGSSYGVNEVIYAEKVVLNPDENGGYPDYFPDHTLMFEGIFLVKEIV